MTSSNRTAIPAGTSRPTATTESASTTTGSVRPSSGPVSYFYPCFPLVCSVLLSHGHFAVGSFLLQLNRLYSSCKTIVFCTLTSLSVSFSLILLLYFPHPKRPRQLQKYVFKMSTPKEIALETVAIRITASRNARAGTVRERESVSAV